MKRGGDSQRAYANEDCGDGIWLHPKANVHAEKQRLLNRQIGQDVKDDHVEHVHEKEEGKQVPSFELPAVGAFAAAGDQEDTGNCKGPTEVK